MAAKHVAPSPKPTSKKATIIPGTEKFIYKATLGKCYQTVEDRSLPFWYEDGPHYKTTEIDLSHTFPDDYFREGTEKVRLILEVEVQEATWTFETTRKKQKVN